MPDTDSKAICLQTPRARRLCVYLLRGGGYTQHKSTDFHFPKICVCVCVCEDGVILTPKAPLSWMWALVKGWSAWAEGLLGLSL